MSRVFWLTLDYLGHAIPLLRFGRARYAICLKADRFYDYPEESA